MNDSKTTHELARLLLSEDDVEFFISVDVSTGDDDAGRRAFSVGPPIEILYERDPCIHAHTASSAIVLFEGYLND